MEHVEPYAILADYYEAITRKQREAHEQTLLELAQSHGIDSLCDFACGTGHFIKRCLDAGMNVFGCDSSKDMVERARLVSGIQDESVLAQADMVTYQPPQRVAMATCNLDSINYLPNLKAWIAFFRNVYACLLDNGLFAFDFDTIFDLEECWSGYKMAIEGQNYICVRTANYDPLRRRGEEEHTWFLYQNGKWRRCVENHTLVSFPLKEVEAGLRSVGFSRIVSRDYDTKEDVYEEETTRIEVWAWK